MFEIDVTCSAPECEEEFQVWTEDLEDLDAVICDACGHSVVTLRVSLYEPQLPVRVIRARVREPVASR